MGRAFLTGEVAGSDRAGLLTQLAMSRRMMTSTMGLLFRAMRPVAGWAESRESRVDIAQAEAPIVWEANGYRRSVVSL